MMLAAVPANSNPSVFAHNHTPLVAANASHSQPGSPDTGPAQTPSPAHVQRGMDGKATTGSGATAAAGNQNQRVPAQIIPITAMHQPFLVGAGVGGYTLVPSIQHLGGGGGSGGDAQLLGIQPMGTLSALPRPGAMIQPSAAIPASYYSRIHQSEGTPIMGFQQLTQQLVATNLSLPSLSPPSALLTSNTGSSSPPTTSSRQPPPPPPPHTLLISGTGNGVILNGSQSSSLESKPTLVMAAQRESSVIVGEGVSRPMLSSSSSPSSASQKSREDDICHRKDVSSGTNAQGAGGRRRSSHNKHLTYSRSRATRHASRSSSNSPPSSVDARLSEDAVKRDRQGDDSASIHCHHGTTTATRRNSDSNLDETAASKSYQINTLIDIPPMAPPLNRASRTSSLSSSLSSFRFGGSLSQLWSLSEKINNMKSTG